MFFSWNWTKSNKRILFFFSSKNTFVKYCKWFTKKKIKYLPPKYKNWCLINKNTVKILNLIQQKYCFTRQKTAVINVAKYFTKKLQKYLQTAEKTFPMNCEFLFILRIFFQNFKNKKYETTIEVIVLPQKYNKNIVSKV